MDIWNNEIIAQTLFVKRGDRRTYFDRLRDVIEYKKTMSGCSMILHTDQGSVYVSKTFNKLLPAYNITYSMFRLGTLTDNGVVEAINVWIKAKMFMDLHVMGSKDVAIMNCPVIHDFSTQFLVICVQFLLTNAILGGGNFYDYYNWGIKFYWSSYCR